MKTMLSTKDQAILLHVARKAIADRLSRALGHSLDIQSYPDSLREKKATFVTLEKTGRLRGCIGTLEAVRPLVSDVFENAVHAVFSDPRFPPLHLEELKELKISISVLTPPEPIYFSSEEDLLEKIQAHRDGLILEEGLRRGTFLPAVWEELPNPRDFLRHLKEKAGLSPDYWSDQIKVSRYEVESFSE